MTPNFSRRKRCIWRRLWTPAPPEKKLGDYTPLRVSTGVEVRWISPIGPLRFSWSRALAKEDDDKTQDLQFSVRY